jgi:hypothetical protein
VLGNISASGSLSASGAGNNYFAGNVGIGTDAPDQKLHVLRSSAGTVTADVNSVAAFEGGGGAPVHVNIISANDQPGGIIFGNPSDNQSAYMYWHYNNRALTLATAAANGYIQFFTGNGLEAARITSTGNVGIGATTPTQKLTVSGSISALSAVYTMGMQPIGFIPFVAKTTGFNLLGALNTNAVVYTVPGGMRAMATGLHIVITNAVGTYTAGTMPSLTIYAGSVSGPNQMIGLLALDTTPNYTAGRTSGTNSIGGNRNTSTSTIIVNIDTAAAGTSYATLEATVYTFGYLIS